VLQFTATISPAIEEILVPEGIELIAALHRNFNQRRKELLQRREQRQADLDAGKSSFELHRNLIEHGAVLPELDLKQFSPA
jgi:malate synthase